MMDNCVSISGDLHLAKTLDALKLKEEGERKLFGENQDLKAELHQVKNTSQLLLEENKQLKSTQQQLCVKMDVLKNSVDGLKRENLELKDKVSQRHQQQSVVGASRGGSGGGLSDRTDGRCHRCVDTDKELSKLKSANNELRYINDQWDKDYREHQEVFRRFREDSRRAQSENESFIATLKESKEQLLEQIRDLHFELEQSRKEMQRLKQQQQAIGYQNGINPKKLKDLEEENTFLRTQLKAYQEDFEAERRDRERLNEEKQSAALRFEAEITSLKLQLDRCRNDLVHYTTESTRLAQQLRLKNQYEEDQYKKHLESQGYIPRSPNSALPPLDPYVENDPRRVQKHLAPPTSGSGLTSRRLAPGQFLARSAEDISKSAPTTTEHRRPSPSPPTVQRNSHPPSPSYINVPNYQAPPPTGQPNGYIMQNGHIAANDQSTNQQLRQQRTTPPQALVNGTTAPYVNGYTNGPQLVTGDGAVRDGYGYPQNFQQLVVGGVSQPPRPRLQQQPQVFVPTVESKGKYACPRCARRFNSKADCSDHKARCMS